MSDLTTAVRIRHVSAVMAEIPVYDVLIAGGGLAGQCLARQLKLARPGLSVAVMDWEKRPLPEAAFKVGEATSELGAHYFAVKLRLKDYLDRGTSAEERPPLFFRRRARPAGESARIRPARFSAHLVVSTGSRPAGKSSARSEPGRRGHAAGRFWRGGHFPRRKRRAAHDGHPRTARRPNPFSALNLDC